MFVLLFLFVATIFFAVKGYDIVLSCLMNWRGMSKLEAENTIHRWANRTARYDFTNDERFIRDMWFSVESVIGSQRFAQLLDLSNTINLYARGCSGLSYVAICTFYTDDSEKRRLETSLSQVVKEWLEINEYDTRVLTYWRKRTDFDIPYLELCFAKNENQARILNNILALNRKKIIARNSDVIDDTEDVDLFG